MNAGLDLRALLAAGGGGTVAGVDGCRAGWIAAIASPRAPVSADAQDDEGAGAPHVVLRVFPRFDVLLDALGPGAAVAVDMPIGLPERIEGPGRPAEKAARPLLGARQSSVFSIPARAAVEAGVGPFRSNVHRRETYAQVCRIAEALSHPPRGVSIQGFGLFPKMIELDRLLVADPALAARLIEGHPELAFRVLNGDRPMALPKKIRGQVNPAGIAERRAVLLARGLARDLLFAPPPTGAGVDDALDACAMLFVAARSAAGLAVPHPMPPALDGRGLPVAIWA